MSIETSKMIYSQQKVAAMIAGKLAKSKGLPYEVYKVPTGFQVVAVMKLKSAMPPAIPLPVKKPTPVSLQAVTGEKVVIVMKFRGESAAYVDVWQDDGKPMSFGKTTLLGWEVQLGNKVVNLLMTEAVAKKRGVMKYAA